jgi:hypothetical protein
MECSTSNQAACRWPIIAILLRLPLVLPG